MVRPYDPVGALGGLFAPAYIASDPVSRAAVEAWNAAHLKTRPTHVYNTPKETPSQDQRDAIAALLASSGQNPFVPYSTDPTASPYGAPDPAVTSTPLGAPQAPGRGSVADAVEAGNRGDISPAPPSPPSVDPNAPPAQAPVSQDEQNNIDTVSLTGGDRVGAVPAGQVERGGDLPDISPPHGFQATPDARGSYGQDVSPKGDPIVGISSNKEGGYNVEAPQATPAPQAPQSPGQREGGSDKSGESQSDSNQSEAAPDFSADPGVALGGLGYSGGLGYGGGTTAPAGAPAGAPAAAADTSTSTGYSGGSFGGPATDLSGLQGGTVSGVGAFGMGPAGQSDVGVDMSAATGTGGFGLGAPGTAEANVDSPNVAIGVGAFGGPMGIGSLDAGDTGNVGAALAGGGYGGGAPSGPATAETAIDAAM